MEEKQALQYRQHFNLSESAKQMLETLTARRYPGKQRRQSQLVEDLIVEAFGKQESGSAAAISDAAETTRFGHKKKERVYQSVLPIRRVAEEGELYSDPDSHPCASCQGEMRAGWKYCVYCGTGLVRCCSCCELPAAEVEGAQFCYDCGGPLL